jgi:hypothetical protein
VHQALIGSSRLSDVGWLIVTQKYFWQRGQVRAMYLFMLNPSNGGRESIV